MAMHGAATFRDVKERNEAGACSSAVLIDSCELSRECIENEAGFSRSASASRLNDGSFAMQFSTVADGSS
jgi:hypothetical protein